MFSPSPGYYTVGSIYNVRGFLFFFEVAGISIPVPQEGVLDTQENTLWHPGRRLPFSFSFAFFGDFLRIPLKQYNTILADARTDQQPGLWLVYGIVVSCIISDNGFVLNY